MEDQFDIPVLQFLNQFAGKNAWLDRSFFLIADTFVLNGAVLVALLWFLWFSDKRDEARSRLVCGTVGAVFGVILSRILQFSLHYHVRPLHGANLNLVWPIGAEPEHWNHWNSFPSDHAAIYFALATVILINHRFLGLLAFFWATIVSQELNRSAGSWGL